MELDAKQQAAVDMCCDTNLKNRIVAITGSAGTGKTTIMRQVAEFFIKEGAKVVATAPTGKAARRIKEATGLEAMTIHRLLEFPKPGDRDERTGKPLNPNFPKRDKDNRINYHVVLCDEYAMVNHELNRQLIDALPDGSLLRCFGDVNQLPPIENNKIKAAGFDKTPFQRYLGDFPSVTLDRVFRTAEGSGIFTNAAGIVRGQVPKECDDFKINFTEHPVRAVEQFVFDHGDTFKKIDNQVICAGNKSWVGTYELNLRLQNLLNPEPTVHFDPPRHKWNMDKGITLGVGDKVVCTENCYDMRDFYERFVEYRDDGSPVGNSFVQVPDINMMLNGETGIIVDITFNPDKKTIDKVFVDMGDRVVEVPFAINEWSFKQNTVFPVNPVKSLDLGYALTTHKCQGSEFQEIVYVLNKSSKWSQNRKNIYTAVTRARKKVSIITDRVSLSYSVWKQPS